MVAVGLWGAFLGGRAMWTLPVVFPVVMAFGGALGVVGVPLPGVETGIALSGIVLGLMVSFAAQAAAVDRGGVGRDFRDFPRSCPWRRNAGVFQRADLRDRVRDRHRTAPPLRHRLRLVSQVAVGADRHPCGWRGDRARWASDSSSNGSERDRVAGDAGPGWQPASAFSLIPDFHRPRAPDRGRGGGAGEWRAASVDDSGSRAGLSGSRTSARTAGAARSEDAAARLRSGLRRRPAVHSYRPGERGLSTGADRHRPGRRQSWSRWR